MDDSPQHDDAAREPVRAPEQNVVVNASEEATTEITPSKKTKGGFDSFVAKVRDISPAWLVNNGSRFCLGFKASADGFSIWSAVRPGSKSPWRLAASLVTMAGEVAGMVFPEKDISDEQREGYRKMSPWKFFVTKTKEALNPKDYITETTGLALIVNGLLMAMSGVSQSVFKSAEVLAVGKKKISWEIAQGLFTSAAGLVMTYWPDRERAWQIAHTTFMFRSVPAAVHAKNAYYHGVPEKNIAAGDWQTGTKWILNQVANVLGTLYGGVKKTEDGSIIHIGKKGEDTTAPRQSRKLVSSKFETVPVAEPAHDINATPKTVVTDAVVDEKLAAERQAVAV